jgi:hypothetical protein
MSAYLCVCEPAAAASEGAAPPPIETTGGGTGYDEGEAAREGAVSRRARAEPARSPFDPGGGAWDERERGGPEGAASACGCGSRARG